MSVEKATLVLCVVWVYRDCIKRTSDKTRIYSILLDNSDQTRMYGTSESIIQALIMTLLQTML